MPSPITGNIGTIAAQYNVSAVKNPGGPAVTAASAQLGVELLGSKAVKRANVQSVQNEAAGPKAAKDKATRFDGTRVEGSQDGKSLRGKRQSDTEGTESQGYEKLDVVA